MIALCQLREMMQEADTNGDHQISFEEFAEAYGCKSWVRTQVSRVLQGNMNKHAPTESISMCTKECTRSAAAISLVLSFIESHARIC